MKNSPLRPEKLACSYFFVMPALAYGILTSRLPALKTAAALDTGKIGVMLLCLGSATLMGLVLADLFIEKFSAKKTTAWAALGIVFFLICAVYPVNFLQMCGCFLLTGFCVGLCDVGMNALGIILEKKHGILCLAFLHGCSSLGGTAGALSGFFFAWLNLSAFFNVLTILCCYLLFFPLACKFVPADMDKGKDGENLLRRWRMLPLFLFYCGVMSLLCHIVEGSTGEWGSLLLVSAKGASQQTATLVFAVFTVTMVISRFHTDSARKSISDKTIVFCGSMGGFIGMSIVLLSPWPILCLTGYGILGLCVAPITPVLFSRAGQTENVTSGEASAIVSIFSYAGLLFFPPFFGLLGEAWGLANALWLIAAFCLCMAGGSVFLKSVKIFNPAKI